HAVCGRLDADSDLGKRPVLPGAACDPAKPRGGNGGSINRDAGVPLSGFRRPSPMNEVPLTRAISRYDHVEDLVSGRVVPEGIRLTCLSLPIEEIFFRFLKYREWDVSEVSFAKYASLISQAAGSLTAIPFFPSRIFRHSSIFVRRDGAVRTPQDLAGKRIGLPEWAQTAAVYSRGLLAHQYGIDLAGIEWIQAGVNEPGRGEKVALNLPPGIRLTPAPTKSLSRMLVEGEVDAVFSAHPPDCFESGEANITQL